MANRFIDLFSGCGGLSLGLSYSGAQGVFAIEKDHMAFRTFAANFMERPKGNVQRFDWPCWLEPRAWTIDELLDVHRPRLRSLRGSVDIVAGGPPCQGFSFAGQRQAGDPRNLLFTKYLEVVEAIRPSAVILENVPGMAIAHASGKDSGARAGRNTPGTHFQRLAGMLDELGYDVEGRIVDASRFGVPQRRERLIVVGLRRSQFRPSFDGKIAALVFEELEFQRQGHLAGLGLPQQISAREAINDLSIDERGLVSCEDPESKAGFLELAYDGRRSRTAYQRLMRRYIGDDAMDSMRLARHRDDIEFRFKQIINSCRQGVRLNDADRKYFGLRKHRVFPMKESEPSPTITTLPDDILHYRDPRILTVRETARLQSFPDWFVFKGKYSTGGDLRKKECPRYSQVGNAVPPLLALAIARALNSVISRLATSSAEMPVSNHAVPPSAELLRAAA